MDVGQLRGALDQGAERRRPSVLFLHLCEKLDLALIPAVARAATTFFGTIAGALILCQLLLALAPGDAIDALPNAEEVRPILEREWHLDQPAPVQLFWWFVDVARGDLRSSLVYRPGMPVTEVIAAPAVRSLGILAAATALAATVGVGLAAWTVGRRAPERLFVWAISLIPVFLLARLVVAGLNALAWRLMEDGAIERPGWFALPLEDHPLRWALAVALLAVGSGALSEVHAEVEGVLGRIRRSGYVEAARARGAPVWPHLVRNLLPPLTTILASRIAFFVGGLVILEKVLLLNGVGAILWQAALERDYPLALGITLVTAGTVAIVRLTADLIRTGLDPRRGAAA